MRLLRKSNHPYKKEERVDKEKKDAGEIDTSFKCVFRENGRLKDIMVGCTKQCRPKGCAVKNWTTFEGVYFNNGMEQTKKKLICTNSVALRKR